MEYRKMENLGVSTSLLGFGCMRFPTMPNGEIDEERAEKMMDTAIAAGVNYIDTAYPYHGGKSEPFVGKVLKKHPRGSFYLATKLPAWLVNSVEDAERIFNEQLARLQTDYIDFYLLHAMNAGRYDDLSRLGVVEWAEKKKAEGKIKYLGFSFHDNYGAFEHILTDRKWDFCQIQLNYMDTEVQAGLKGYELTEKLGVPLVIMEPVKGGSLTTFADDIANMFRSQRPDASLA
ncbi:MAG: aldo/keto reductase, partial [Lachnospiraceae bacterium]|nr:aldo/keto reductase [Lachnospiraceae bacterium]